MFHMQFEANYNLMSLLYEHEAINPILPWQLSRRFNSAPCVSVLPWPNPGLIHALLQGLRDEIAGLLEMAETSPVRPIEAVPEGKPA